MLFCITGVALILMDKERKNKWTYFILMSVQ
jgi:hypothetical protein